MRRRHPPVGRASGRPGSRGRAPADRRRLPAVPTSAGYPAGQSDDGAARRPAGRAAGRNGHGRDRRGRHMHVRARASLRACGPPSRRSPRTPWHVHHPVRRHRPAESPAPTPDQAVRLKLALHLERPGAGSDPDPAVAQHRLGDGGQQSGSRAPATSRGRPDGSAGRRRTGRPEGGQQGRRHLQAGGRGGVLKAHLPQRARQLRTGTAPRPRSGQTGQAVRHRRRCTRRQPRSA